MIYPHNGIQSGNKKEWNIDTCCNMDEIWKHGANHKRWHIIRFYLDDIHRISKSRKTEIRAEAAWGWRTRVKYRVPANGLSFGGDENILNQ